MDGIDTIDTGLGAVTWHSSDINTGPDVGVTIGLGNGKTLYVGEISKDLHETGGEEAAALGDDTGWWMVMWPEADLLARFVDRERALSFMERMEAALVP